MRYYDTNVFQHAQNPSESCHKDCCRIIEPEAVGWDISVNLELIGAESSVRDFAERVLQVLVSSSPAGVAVDFVDCERERQAQKPRRPLKKALETLHLQPLDIRHVFSAIASNADHIVTSDQDFWDPVRKAGEKKTRVAQTLRNEGLEVCAPKGCV